MGGCLQIELAPWKRVAITRLFALGPALAVALSTVENQKLFININEYLNILQSVQLPFAMLPVLHFASSHDMLGRFASGRTLFAVTCGLAMIVLIVNVVLVVQFLQAPPVQEQGDESEYHFPPWVLAVVALYAVVYFGVCARMMWSELKELGQWIVRTLGGEAAGVQARRSSLPPELVLRPSGSHGRPQGHGHGNEGHEIPMAGSPGNDVAQIPTEYATA